MPLPLNQQNMRNIKTILCGLYTLATIVFAASVSAQTGSYTHNGVTIKIYEIEIEAGAENPFSVLHISDSHLVYADERDGERKVKLAAKRAKKMRNSEAVLNVHRQYAMENNLMIVHSGDMMDFNHPMAGKTLNFDVEIVEVRDVTPEDLAPKGGCSCGCDHDHCGEGCEGCGEEHHCGEGDCHCH